MDLILYSRSFTSATNDAAYAITAGEELRIMNKVTIASGDYKTLDGSVTIANKGNLALPFQLDTDNNEERSIYANLVTRGTPTYTAADKLTVRLHVLHKGAN